MTFVLKELSELRKHFDDTVDIILKRESKGKIEDLTNPNRKYELQFLTSILLKLEEQAKEKSPNLAYLSTVFYGAMLTVMQDIENNRGVMESSGLLNDRLKDAVGIGDEVKAEDKPDLYQNAKFHTALNTFLNQIFIEHDSRKGFAKDHMLTAVPTDNLSKLIQTSYKLEKDAQRAIVASFTTDGETISELVKFKAAKKSPISATNRFGGWEKLNADLDELIKEELADKNVAKIEKLKSKERICQLHFLNAIRESLKTAPIDEAEKTAILAGSMHLVRQQIKNEYASSYVSHEENSVILTGKKKKKGLNQILAVDEVNPQDVEALVTSATQYIQFMTVAPKINNKKAIRAAHIFSAITEFNPEFNLQSIFNLLIDMIHACRADALKVVVEEFKKETKAPEKPAKGYLGGLSSALGSLSFYNRSKKEDDEEEEDELEHKSNMTNG
ncbi:hypothetical protein [Legionella cherrii]|uniref:Dot/Icm secretion system substrate n=1 Tax=Legionella cherrii TaxID=28084 RepID=A0A0W0SAH2_9GAMM|nr:hypothetical protein [Legionella cherrii]KTC80456.1 substrate of the Dot/Icm secretion system [Legionella cherrii]VEB39192.1 Dot/Icm secretion system substrate [Legionella cherrii]